MQEHKAQRPLDDQAPRTYQEILHELDVDGLSVGDELVEAAHVVLGLIRDTVRNGLQDLGDRDEALRDCQTVDTLHLSWTYKAAEEEAEED